MRRLLPIVLSTVSLAAQSAICHAEFDNLNFDNASSMGGPNLMLGVKATATAAFAATRIEVFTGEQTGSNAIALWTHDAAGNRPAVSLGSGSWTMSRINGWQGANLATPINIAAGQTFWLVWSPINGAQSSHLGTAVGAQQYRGSFDGGSSWSGPFQGYGWKFRIWCGGPHAVYETFGSACSGSSRTRPDLNWFGLPTIGTQLNIHLDRALGNSFALLTVGDSNTSWAGNALPFSLAGVGAPGCNVLASVAETVFTPIDPVGSAVVTLTLPLNPVLVGTNFYDQWFVHDPVANALQFVVSNAGHGVIGL